MNKPEFLEYLHGGNITGLFLASGWNQPTSVYDFDVTVGEATFTIHEAAQKGVRVYTCSVEKVPLTAIRCALDTKLRKSSSEYLLVFLVQPTEGESMHHFWMVPVKGVDKRDLVSVEYVTDDQANFLLDKINAITFAPDENVTVVDVVDRITKTFLVNSADVTKKFYQGFRNQHKAFVAAIENIELETDREWYASVVLNRLMFCYFIQKKGFLDLDFDYLGRKLREVQAKKGEDQFYQSFYRSFLKQLFSDGLDKPIAERSEYFLKKYGRIPYLNGGMFAKHDLERKYKDLDIPDKIFKDLFAFFDQWCWHLDTKLTASGRDINPDVLGYIFEQYINDRAQMGAYYTKEDITEYIGRNTIVPYLIETTAKKLPASFKPEGEVWSLLKASGDKYIFAAVKKGINLPLPANIERGVDTVGRSLRERRADWNKPADDAYALPTEIWRETVARRQRCEDIKAKIKTGKITDIHDFITYNLDIRAFVEDVIRATPNLDLVKTFYGIVREVTILDPTCGSGAFLFAALNILEPLYEACLDRMEENPKKFKAELDEIKGKFRSNRQYFIYKNIILRNLYGVDIMREATEIARLRLFLKMVAVVDVDEYDPNLGLDPLPDIDFNVKCGNTLVGYANEKEIDAVLDGDLLDRVFLKGKINEEMEKAADAFNYFRREQLNLNGDHEQLIEAKHEASLRLDVIRSMLNDHIYDHHAGKKKADWLRDTQPFHWYTEFYPIMHDRGGFDVIIGNPPYVVYNNDVGYVPSVKETFSCKDLYAYVIERALKILKDGSGFGMVVPISIVSTDGFKPVRDLMASECNRTYFSNFAMRPGKLFEGAEKHLSIFVASKKKQTPCDVFAGRYCRWSDVERPILFSNIYYVCLPKDVCLMNSIPKIATSTEVSIIQKMKPDKLAAWSFEDSSPHTFYHTRKLRYFVQFLDKAPIIYNEDGSIRETSELKSICVSSETVKDSALAVYLSTLFFWFFISYSDCRNLNKREVDSFPCDLNNVASKELADLGRAMIKNLQDHSYFVTANYKKYGQLKMQTFQPRMSKMVADQIDELLAKHYGFTEEELDFIINYDIKYRMGDELNAE